MYDLIIKNASVIDGSGGKPYSADIAIKNGVIAAIGNSLGAALETLDVRGLALSAGWIDSHSHSDSAYINYPDMTEKVEQGITYSITGQCGDSAAPLRRGGKIVTVSEFLKSLSDIPQGSGSAMLVGFNTVREAVIGRDNRAPTAEELSLMCDLIRDALRAGAIGMSFGIFYVPACYADTEELITVSKVVREEDGILACHIRNEADDLIESVKEYIKIIKESGCRAVFSHHKAMGRNNFGKVRESLALIDAAIEDGADIYLDVYPYIASGTTMLARFCPGSLHPEGTTNALSLLYDRSFCERLKAWGTERWGTDLSWTLVSACPGHPEYEGKTVSEIARMRGETDEYETAFEIIRMTDGRARGSFFMMCEEDLEYVIRHPRAMICTDSSVKGASKIYHPRLRASFPRALGRYARERGVITIEEMIRRMTSLPASVYGLSSKGRIEVGMDADICIFDRDEICDRADYISFSENNVGLKYVLINGRIVLEGGAYNGTRAAFVKTVFKE